MNLRSLLSLSLSSLCAACIIVDGGDDAASDESTGTPADSSGSADESTGADPGFDADEVIAMAATYATTLEKISDQPFASQHGAADMVGVYVNSEAAALFRTLDPEAPVEVDLPEGTLIVKEHFDDAGAFSGFLLMYRGPEGYAPMTGDWFWAATNAGGDTLTAGASGGVDFCISCHTPAPSFVFGVAADNQT